MQGVSVALTRAAGVADGNFIGDGTWGGAGQPGEDVDQAVAGASADEERAVGCLGDGLGAVWLRDQELSRVLIAVDWTDDGQYKVLEASLVMEGRAIPLYCRTLGE